MIARGDRVRVLARENADLSALAGLPVEIVRGDLRYFDSIERAVNGCNEVYHVGADYRLWLTDPAPMYATNVDGTEHVIRAATGAGVSRIVYTSTVGALGIPHGGVGTRGHAVVARNDARSLQAIEVYGGAGGARRPRARARRS